MQESEKRDQPTTSLYLFLLKKQNPIYRFFFSMFIALDFSMYTTNILWLCIKFYVLVFFLFLYMGLYLWFLINVLIHINIDSIEV
jgi:hypothetical protein